MSKYTLAKFRILPNPATANEVHFIYDALSSLAPIVQFRYLTKSMGHLAIAYPRTFTVLFEEEKQQSKDNDSNMDSSSRYDGSGNIKDILPRIVGVPRLSYYNKLFENQKLPRHIHSDFVTAITKDNPVLLKSFQNSNGSRMPKLQFNEMFLLKAMVLETGDQDLLLDSKEDRLVSRDKEVLEKELDVISQGFLKKRNYL